MALEDRFSIEEPIYVGQMATAYPAFQKGLDRKVLLKLFHKHWADDSELIERFSREGKAMARIDHPNVVRIYEYGHEDGVPYLAMEWVDGGTLEDKLKAGPLPQKEIVNLARDLLTGLQAVHREDLLHRDLKPDNILIEDDGRARLADFSLAGFERSTGLTVHGAIVGSPSYMAPELSEGNPATFQSDLYGLGVILLEALTGSNPFAASDPLVSLDLIRKVEPPKLSGRQNIDPGLGRLIDTLLHKNPARRPKDAQAALSLLSAGSDAEEPPAPEKSGINPWLNRIVLSLSIIAVMIYVSYKVVSYRGVVPDLASLDTLIRVESSTIVQSNKDTISDLVVESIDTVMLDISEKVIQTQPPVSKAVLSEGFLTVVVKPWAEVYIDGQSRGMSPIGTRKLRAGSHILHFQHNALPDVIRKVEISGGQNDTLTVDLRSEAGQVNISASPWGILWVDEDSIGFLPRSDSLWLSPGRHFIEIRHPELDRWSDSLQIGAGDRLSIRVNMVDGTMIADKR